MSEKKSKFKVLEYNQMIMARIGIHSHNLDDPTNEFFKRFISFYFLFVIVFLIVGSIVFACINWPQYNVISEPCLIAVGCLQVGGMFLGFGLKMKTVKQLHHELQAIVDAENDEQVASIHWNTEQNCRQFTAKFMKFVFANQSMYAASLLFSFYCMIVNNFDTSTWILPFTLWVPFNTEHLLGWYLLLFIQFSMGMAYSMSQVTITAYFVCCCNYIGAICEHFNLLMNSVRADVEFNLNEKNPHLHQNRCREIERKLATAVSIHEKAYDIFNMVSEVNTGVIFALLPGNTLLLGLTMFNVEHTTFEVVMFVWHLISIACALVWPTLFCYSASDVIDKIANIGDIAYDSNWYHYPPELRKHIILIIARSQEDIIFSGLSLIGCSVEVFGNLFRSSCSYYLAFRAVSDI
ncbi:odorant receptor 4-like [Contarinia nasturtii]|uniref:odorant receptor 4-like n=1 Tax=Contarinia nasturtii TaxID=265458 RepID=UPI0012D3D178|nr:odorant receptor 4-like [Contarinia nasturtii]